MGVATAGYCVGNLYMEGWAIPGEDASFAYPASLAPPLQVSLLARQVLGLHACCVCEAVTQQSRSIWRCFVPAVQRCVAQRAHQGAQLGRGCCRPM